MVTVSEKATHWIGFLSALSNETMPADKEGWRRSSDILCQEWAHTWNLWILRQKEQFCN